jgi:cysteine desulfurase
MKLPIYLDHHATTPVDPRVLDAMLPYLGPRFGNAGSSSHALGWEAAEAVGVARERVARLIGAKPNEILFTAGATESISLALLGLHELHEGREVGVVTVATEHHAGLETCRHLERRGVPVTVLPVDGHGRVDPGDVARSLDASTLVISAMAANNEVGTLHPLREIGRACRERGVLFHCDAAQAYGKLPLEVDGLGIDLLSVSAHKLYGPKGVGFLYVRSRDPHVRLSPRMHGGGQERGLRPGTLNVPGIVGLGRAAEICAEEMATEATKTRGLRDRLEARLVAGIEGVRVNGHPTERLPGNLSVSFGGLDAEALVLELGRTCAVSLGAACASGHVEPSHVLRAMGVPDDLARRTLRFGLGRFTTAEEVDVVAEATIAAAGRLRAASSPARA